MAAVIHPAAFVDPGAKLGVDVHIGPCAIVEANTEIGDRCRLDAFAQVKAYTRMGAGNRVHSYAIVGGEPQDLKFRGEESWVIMGDNNTVREYATVHRGTEAGGGSSTVGSGCLLMAYTHIAHDCHLGNGVIMSNGASLAGHVDIADHAIVGGMSGVHQFVRIGEHAFIGAMSGVGQDVPPYMIAAGSRALLHGPNRVGLMRRGMSAEAISALKRAYRTIWRSGMLRADALAEVEGTYPDIPEVMRLVEFVRASQRGVLAAEEKGGEAEE